MPRRIILILVIAAVLVAIVSISGVLRQTDQRHAIRSHVESFADHARMESFEMTVLTEKAIASYGAEAVPILLEGLENGFGATRGKRALIRGGCARTLGWIEDDAAGPALLELVQSEDEWFMLASAIYGLSQQSYQPAEEDLVRILNDTKQHVRVRSQAAVALGRIGGAGRVTQLVERFAAEGPQLMKGVVAAFQYIEGTEGPSRLVDAYLRRHAEGAHRVSLRVLKDLLDLVAVKSGASETIDPALPGRLTEIRAWNWNEEDVNLNSMNDIIEVGKVQTAELLASLCMASYACGHSNTAVELFDRAVADAKAVSPGPLPEAVAHYFARLNTDRASEAARTSATQAARRTISQLIERLDRSDTVARPLALRCLEKVCPQVGGDRTVEAYKTWWDEEKDRYTP